MVEKLQPVGQGVNQRHHFVPQFYLRQLSRDGRSIRLFNFRRDALIENASIRRQCARRNFYGFSENVESSFADLEGVVATIIQEIRRSQCLPDKGSEQWRSLLGYVVFQKARTARAGNASDHLTDYLMKLQLQGHPAARSVDLDKYRIGHKYPTQVPLSVTGDVIGYAESLAAHLVINESPIGLITSDDPVVVHNQYCEGITYRGVKGWGSSGVQVFFPLSPRELLLLFDAAIYKVGRSHRGDLVTRVTLADDVNQANSLQILNADENVYLPPTEDPLTVAHFCREVARRRPATRMRFVETEAVPMDDGRRSSLVHQYEPLLPARLELSFVRVRTKARGKPLEARVSRRGALELTAPRSGVPAAGSDLVRYGVKAIIDK